MHSVSKTVMASLAALVMAVSVVPPASAEPLTKYKQGFKPYKSLPGNKLQQPMPKPLPVKKHGHKHNGRNVALGIAAAATAAAIAASSGGSRCRRWAVQCEDGSRRACRKYEDNCE